VYDRWPTIRLLDATPPTATAPRWLQRVLAWQAGAVLMSGLFIFALGATMRAGAGASQPASLAMAAGFAAVLTGMIYLAGADRPAAADPTIAVARNWRPSVRAVWTEPRVRLTGLFLFPALVWMISAPLVSAVEGALSGFLLQKVTAVVFFVFDSLGLLLERHGNVLILPDGKGTVGVAEACSGIRSLTGSLFSGAFLAAVFLRPVWKKIALVLAALLLAFGTNILRSLFLTSWAYAYGAQAIEGPIHDGTGFAVLGLTFFGLLVLVRIFNFQLPALELPTTAAEGVAPAETHEQSVSS
jgi:exosortase